MNVNKLKCVIDGINIFEYDYEKWRHHEECNSLMTNGVAYRFNDWLSYNGIEYESVYETDINLAGPREGNRFDIHDNYRFSLDDEYKYLEISFLYVANGTLWAVLYNKSDDSWFGEFEIPNIGARSY